MEHKLRESFQDYVLYIKLHKQSMHLSPNDVSHATSETNCLYQKKIFDKWVRSLSSELCADLDG